MDGKTVVIIGGSSGIGLRTAVEAAQAGAFVIVAGRTPEKLERAREQIGRERCSTHVLDNRTPQAVEAFFREIDRLDHLFAPAASYTRGPITSDLATAESCFAGKFWPQYWAVKYAADKIDKSGSVVLMSGAYSRRPPNDGASYAACNAAIEGLARALAVEMAPIRVNAVAPGTIRTPFVWEERAQEEREQAYRDYAGQCLAGRVGTVEEVASAVLYLMTNSFTTGSTLFPDGGYTLS